MVATMYAADGVGLAACQIGVDLAVFVFDCPDEDGDAHRGRGVQPGADPARGPGPPPRRRATRAACRFPGAFVECARPDAARVDGLGLDGEAGRRSRATACWPAACSTRPTTPTARSSATGSPPRPRKKLGKSRTRRRRRLPDDWPASRRLTRPRTADMSAPRARTRARRTETRTSAHQTRTSARKNAHLRQRWAGDVAGHRGRGGDVEGVDARRHRDDRAPVGRRLPAPREAVALGAEHQREPVDAGHGLLDRHGVGGQGQRDRREARADRSAGPSYQSSQPGPRHREHRPHADLDRAAVERVGAPRREQHRVEPQRRTGAEDGADVGVVDHVLEHQHRPGAGQHDVDRGQRPTLQGGQRAPVHVEAGDLLGELLGQDVARAHRCEASTSASPSSQRGAIRNDRGRKPASTARRTTFSPSARNRPCSASRFLRSSTSRRSR